MRVQVKDSHEEAAVAAPQALRLAEMVRGLTLMRVWPLGHGCDSCGVRMCANDKAFGTNDVRHVWMHDLC